MRYMWTMMGWCALIAQAVFKAAHRVSSCLFLVSVDQSNHGIDDRRIVQKALSVYSW